MNEQSEAGLAFPLQRAVDHYCAVSESVGDKEKKLLEFAASIKDEIPLEELQAKYAELGLTKGEALDIMKRRVKALDGARAIAEKHLAELRRIELMFTQMHQLRTSGSMRRCLDLVEPAFPAMYARAYPRAYQMPHGYASPKRLAIIAMLAAWGCSNWKDTPWNDTAKNRGLPNAGQEHLFRVSSELIDLLVPTYFVSRSIMHELINTDLPRDFSLSDMPWPMEAMLFVLPDGQLTSPAGSITFLALVKCPARKIYGGEWVEWPNVVQKDIMLEHVENGETDIVNYNKAIQDPGYNVRIYPGDNIWVPRRFW